MFYFVFLLLVDPSHVWKSSMWKFVHTYKWMLAFLGTCASICEGEYNSSNDTHTHRQRWKVNGRPRANSQIFFDEYTRFFSVPFLAVLLLLTFRVCIQLFGFWLSEGWTVFINLIASLFSRLVSHYLIISLRPVLHNYPPCICCTHNLITMKSEN